MHPDHLGTPRVVADAAGVTVWRWDNLEPFGLTGVQTDPDGNGQAFVFNLRFAGQYFDAESGLFHNRHRDYDSASGRYVQADPIGLAGGISLYSYVGANPLGFVDPLGLACEKPGVEAAKETTYLYRGVSAGHPAIDAAKRGSVVPGNLNGSVSSAAHNEGGHAAQSAFTSWTHDPAVAGFHAAKNGPGGVVLRVPQGAPQPGASWSWHRSDDIWGESEVLLKGVRHGVEVLPK